MSGATRKGSPEPGSSRSPDSEQPVAISKPSRRDERYAKSDFVVQWDPQEGLMPQILSITSSPRKEIRKKKNNILIIGSNRECASCREGGDLVCCSRCNSCFHTLCHNPPLDDDNLPQAKWTCFNCQSMLENPTASDTVSPPVTGTEAKTVEEEPQLSHAFEMLLKAVEYDNSEEFQLAKEVSLPYVFSGFGKPTKKRLREMKQARLDQGLVPLPVRTCFTCDKSARIGPLVQCDYCPLMFHADCLDPPLTTIPLSRWMCPNHPNHMVDDKMTSDKHSERVKLWDEYCCNSVTEQKVMIDFFHKNSRKFPPFNRKRTHECDIVRVAIPSHIKEMYRSARGRRERNEWLNGVITMNPSIFDFENVTVDDLGDSTVKLLAARMLEQLRPLKRQQQRQNAEMITVTPKAFLTPGLGSSGPQICITESHLVVGKSSSADINLEYYGNCKFASPHHAVIFFDEPTNLYELINYSEFGTHVDGVLHSNNVENLVKEETKSITDNIRFSLKERKTDKKRIPMKRGRKSKAEKAAMAAAAAAEAAADLTNESNSNQNRSGFKDTRLMASSDKGSRTEFNRRIESACVDSEDTLSAAGGRSTPAVPKSENSDREDLNGLLENGSVEHSPNRTRGLSNDDDETNDALGDVNGSPKECICEQNNLMGMQLPMSGYEGSAILHNGSVLRIGCIVLLFTRVD